MTELVNSPTPRGTHALVIGVGQYPWLNGGNGPLFAHEEGMGQLSSPPHSARAFATWLLESYNNNVAPLASLELLISDSSTDRFALPNGTTTLVERANFLNIKAAVKRWYQRGDSDPDNVLIYFFCGHGVAQGLSTTLLAEDYGSVQAPPQASLGLAIDFNGLYLGLDSCAARHQLFFVDACRVASGLLIRTMNYAGDPIIPGMAQLRSPPRSGPIYYGTLPGDAAFGRTGKESFFTEALLKAFRGAGADDDGTGNWQLMSDTLGRGIHHQLRRIVANTSAAGQNSLATNLGVPVAFHKLPGLPECPVDVICDPAHETAIATLEVADGANRVMKTRDAPRPAHADAWGIDLDSGNYTFVADCASAPGKRGRNVANVAPPYRLVKIPVT